MIDKLTQLYPNSKTNLEFYVNNSYKQIDNANATYLLLDYLRENGYTGTKTGCGEGGCGACTIVIADYDPNKKLVRYRTANSCLLPLCAVHNKQVITVEGIGCPEKPHSVQERLAAGNSSQCGFCTPGIIMSLYGLLKIKQEPSLHDIEDAFDGNLCRCTGYRPILESARTFAKNSCQDQCSTSSNYSKSQLVDFSHFKKYDPSMDVPFPVNLLQTNQNKILFIGGENSFWIKPFNLDELLVVKNEYPNAKIVSGNSEIGIEMKFKGMDYNYFIFVGDLTDLQKVEVNENVLEIGVNISLNELIESLKKLTDKVKPYQQSLLKAFLSNLRWFASNQIRNFATLAGNITTASPISDLNPILVASNAVITVQSKIRGTRQISMRDFFLGYRKIDLKPDEVVVRVDVPLPDSNLEIFRAYKQAKRKDDDIAITNGGFRVVLDKINGTKQYKINQLDLALGGVAPTTVYLKKVAEQTKNLIWGVDKNLKLIEDLILEQVNLSYSVPGGMPTFRRTLAVSFFTKFWYQVIKELNIDSFSGTDLNLHNIEDIEREISSSIQDFGTDKNDVSIGTTTPHASALKQTTGVAKYLDDIPKVAGEKYAGLVLSTKAHARIANIDTSAALSLSGVVGFINHKDVPNCNRWGIIIKDEEFFASEEVNFVGQLIGIVVADSRQLAKKAASLVKIEYKELDSCLTIEDALEKNSFFDGFNFTIEKGTPIKDENDLLVFEGECRVGGQEHFYLETHGCLVVPRGEDNELEIYSSTQHPTETQGEIAHVLGIPINRISCKIKRIGGGFGGKETRATFLAVAIAVAAHKLSIPIRCILDREIDMLISGTRHPFWGKYKLYCTRDGFFKSYDLKLVSNAGHSYDLSRAVMERAMTHCDNVYYFPHLKVNGKLAKTNIASNTAFRGFGGPQGMIITEMMIAEVADKLRIDPVVIRQQNMYKPNDVTHYNMPLDDFFVPEMWAQILVESEYHQQRAEIEKFNSENKWKKRGLAILPTKFGISFTARFLNQAGALVHIYTDGSVLLSHGGVEMGQGLHTKMIQIAANTLQIPEKHIHIVETSTDKVPNTSPTAASASSDLNGMAVLDACNQLAQRLKPYKEKNPNGNISTWAMAAYLDRVNLSANGFYKTPDLTYDWETNTGRMFFYFTSGIAVSSVELDVLTGDHTILRTDIVMDIGQSINFSIDIGQIEGAFMQGVGWSTIEEQLVLPGNGAIFTRGPGTYKIPGFRDVPQKFNVKILRDKCYKNLKTIKSSKGIGEPPLFLGASVYFALRDAVTYARKENGISEPLIGFQSPCTSEILRLACEDSIVQKSRVLPKLLNNSSQNMEKLWSVRP